jgi:hypothetical protein
MGSGGKARHFPFPIPHSPFPIPHIFLSHIFLSGGLNDDQSRAIK